MKYCKKCRVSVNNPLVHCPLCYATLTQKDDRPELLSYPDLAETAEKYNILYRILLFLSLSVSTICVTVNILTSTRIWWSLLVVANILYMWIAIGTAIRRHNKIGFTVMVQAISLAAMLFVIDRFTNSAYGWMMSYALPCLFFSATLSITIIIIVRRMAIRDFILYFFIIALLGFIPLVLYLVGWVHVFWPSLACALYSALSMVSIFIFADRATKVELKKRFHI